MFQENIQAIQTMSIGRKREQFSILKISWPNSPAGDLSMYDMLFKQQCINREYCPAWRGWRALRIQYVSDKGARSRAKERKWLHKTVNYQKRQGILQAAEEILEEIAMKQWQNMCVKILARISGKMRENDKLAILSYGPRKATEMCIWRTDRHTVGKLPSPLCFIEK